MYRLPSAPLASLLGLERRIPRKLEFASTRLEDHWMPRILEAAVAWEWLQIVTVARGLRRMAVLYPYDDYEVRYKRFCQRRGLA